MASGIYQIVCLFNGKNYIGSAINLDKRWSNHKWYLNKNIHHNLSLQNSWNKYGEEAFDWNIIELCEKKDLIIREQYYLDYIEPEFNMCKIAGSCLGYKHTKETKEKKRIAMTGNTYAKGKLGTTFVNSKRPFPDEYIREIRASKLSDSELAQEYGVARNTIYQIRNQKSYKDVF